MKLTILCRVTGSALAGGLLGALTAPPLQAETITIGAGSGVVWEGLPFNATMDGHTGPIIDVVPKTNGIISIGSTSTGHCSNQVTYEKNGIRLGPGVWIIPRATGFASYYRYNGKSETVNATLGLPETKGVNNGTGEILGAALENQFCIAPSTTQISQFYAAGSARHVEIAGTWVIVTDGTQKTGEYKPQYGTVYAGSYNPQGTSFNKPILPDKLTLRVTTLVCTVSTPTTINFGTVTRDTEPNAELATQSQELTVSCGQDSNKINANINVQLRALTGLYNGEPTRLALTQGGGYITAGIDNTVAGNGACTSNSGVRFDNMPIKVGEITRLQDSQTFTNRLTWRLCSGGSSLPSGKVDAAAELMTTFN